MAHIELELDNKFRHYHLIELRYNSHTRIVKNIFHPSITALWNTLLHIISFLTLIHTKTGTTMSNVQYAHTTVVASKFNANGTDLD